MGRLTAGNLTKSIKKSGTLRVEIIQKLSWKINRKFIGTQRHGDTEDYIAKAMKRDTEDFSDEPPDAWEPTGALTGGTNGHWPKGKVNPTKSFLKIVRPTGGNLIY